MLWVIMSSIYAKHICTQPRGCVLNVGAWPLAPSLLSVLQGERRENIHTALPRMVEGERGERERDEGEAEDITFVLHLSHNPPLLLHYREGERPEDARRYDTAATL